MNRLVIDARESGTSTGRYIDNLIKYLSKLNPEFEIVLLAKPHRAEHYKKIAPNFNVIKTSYQEFTFSEQLGLWRQLRKIKPDLVHFGMPQQPILYRGKSVTTIHDLTTARFKNPSKNAVLFTIKQLIYKWVVKIVANKSATIITPSKFVKKDIANFTRMPQGKITVIHEAADRIQDAAEPFKILQGQPFIMYVGRPQPHKNLQRLVLAFSELKNKHPELKLVLVGKNDTLFEQLEVFVQKQKIADVVFSGFVSEGTLRWLYEHTAVYVFPSLSEGFGLPGLEAMAQGTPVASSNATCLPEVYGDAAHYFNPLDVHDMASKINEVLTSEKLRKELIAKGQEQVKKYSWQKMAEQTLEIYRKVLNSKSSN